jgi:hypothetical protein
MSTQACVRPSRDGIEAVDKPIGGDETANIAVSAGAAVLGEQTHSHAADAPAECPVPLGRFPRRMELAVDSHAPVGEVRGSNGQEPIVDDHELGMNVCGHGVVRDAAGGKGKVTAERMSGVGRDRAELFDVLRLA